MVKNIALICVAHPDVKNIVDKMGDVITSAEFDALVCMAFTNPDLMYSPATICQEGSPMYNRLRDNGWVEKETSRKYDVIKEVSFKRAK